MPDLWMPGVQHVPIAGNPGTAMVGPFASRKCIIHTTETSSIPTYIGRFPPHLSWNPTTGTTLQHIPANLAAYALLHTGNIETNRYGLYCIQIEVVGYAALPFTDDPLKNWEPIHAWLQSLGIPDTWPNGPNLPAYPASFGVNNGHRNLTAWTKSGYFGHSNVPTNEHGDPGAIDGTKLTEGVDMAGEADAALASFYADGGTQADVRGNYLYETGRRFGRRNVAIPDRFKTNGVADPDFKKGWDDGQAGP